MRAVNILLILLLAWAVVATGLASYFYVAYTSVSSELATVAEKTISVNLLIDYGNGTAVWYNGTILPRGATLLTALLSVAKVNYTIGAYGAFIQSINGVSNKAISSKEGLFWMWYRFNAEAGGWEIGPVAADSYRLRDGEIVKWSYEKVKW